jgi:hypothetical protein
MNAIQQVTTVIANLLLMMSKYTIRYILYLRGLVERHFVDKVYEVGDIVNVEVGKRSRESEITSIVWSYESGKWCYSTKNEHGHGISDIDSLSPSKRDIRNKKLNDILTQWI